MARRLWSASGLAARFGANSPASRSTARCPRAGSKIQVDGKDVGEITSATSLRVAGGERRLALGYIRREVATPGKPVDAGGSAAAVANLPFAEIFK